MEDPIGPSEAVDREGGPLEERRGRGERPTPPPTSASDRVGSRARRREMQGSPQTGMMGSSVEFV